MEKKVEYLLEELHESDAKILDLQRQLFEKEVEIKRYKEILEEISDYPKVRGIGGLMDSYNEMITKAENAIKKTLM